MYHEEFSCRAYRYIAFRIYSLIPKRFDKWKLNIEQNIMEVKEDYTMSIKKALVDFVLGESVHRNSELKGRELSSERKYVSTIALKYRHKLVEPYSPEITYNSYFLFTFVNINSYLAHRVTIKRNLFSINPCVAQVLKVWHTFHDTNFISVPILSAHKGAFDLSEFTVSHTLAAIKNKVNYKPLNCIFRQLCPNRLTTLSCS